MRAWLRALPLAFHTAAPWALRKCDSVLLLPPVFDLISVAFSGDAGRRAGWIEEKHQANPTGRGEAGSLLFSSENHRFFVPEPDIQMFFPRAPWFCQPTGGQADRFVARCTPLLLTLCFID
jgi:hypothetical protein